MISSLQKPSPKAPSSPSEYASSDSEAFPWELPSSSLLDSLESYPDPTVGTPPDTPEFRGSPLPKDLEELPDLADLPSTLVTSTVEVERSGEKLSEQNPVQENPKKGPVTEPLLTRLMHNSEAFHNLRRRSKEVPHSKPRLKRFPDKPSLAIQETVIRKERKKLKNSKKSKFSCDLCKVKADNKTVLEEHLTGSKHKSQVARTYERTFCDVCNKDLKHPKCLERHLKGSKHRQNRTFGASEVYKVAIRK